MRGRGLFGSLILAVPALAFQAPASGVVEGRVVDSATGQPLAEVRVTLAQIPIVMGMRPTSGVLGEDFYDPTLMPAQRVGQAPPVAATTGPDGQFRMSLNPGRYHVRAERTGFFPTPAGVTYLSLIPGERLKGVTIKLTASCAVSGKVLDAEGRPMAQVRVQGLRWTIGSVGGQRVLAPQGTASTGADGEYRMVGLPPGTYVFAAEPGAQGERQPKSAYVTTFAGGATDAAAAGMKLAPGSVRAGVDFRMRRVPVVTVSGKVTGGAAIAGKDGGVMVALQARDPDGYTTGPRFTQVNADGTFVLPDVPAGAYLIRATAVSEGQVRLAGRMALDVADSDVQGLTVPLRAGGPLAGRIRFAEAEGVETPAVDAMNLWLQPPAGSYSGTAHSAVDAEGRFRFRALEDESYRLQTVGLPRGYYVKSIRLNGREFAPQAIQPAEGGELVLTLERGTAELSGRVLYPSEQPASDVQVMVMNAGGEMVRSAVSLIDGQYRMAELPPGTYRVFPVVDADIFDASTLDRLAASATVIPLAKSARESRNLIVR